MKVHKIWIIIVLLIAAAIPRMVNAQFGQLKKKMETAVRNSGSDTKTSRTENTKTERVTKNSQESSGARTGFEYSDNDLKMLKSRYEPIYLDVRNFPNKEYIKPGYALPDHLAILKSIQWDLFLPQLEMDRATYPELFAYYGIEEPGRYADLLYGGNKRAPWEGKSTQASTVNSYIMDFYEFKGKLIGTEKGFAQIIQSKIQEADNASVKEKMDKAVEAMDWLTAVKTIQPNNPYLSEIQMEAEKMLNRALAGIDHLMTGNFHRKNLKKLVGFSHPVTVGKENTDQISFKFEAGKPHYLVGYFQADMKSTGGIPTLIIEHYDEEYYTKKSKGFVDNDPHKYTQAMYVPASVKAKEEQKGYYEFSFFPAINTLKYSSHLELIPYLNVAKWVTTLLPGEYDLQIAFGLRNEMARGKFTMLVTPEGKEAARKYYDELHQLKVAAVTVPLENCKNNSGAISNLSDMQKYGTLKFIGYEITGNIMFPWPKDDQVQFNTASGYGVFEKDGKTEIIQLEFRKTPSEQKFKFHSLGEIPAHLAMVCPNQLLIKPEILNYGYEMLVKNIANCKKW